MKTSKYTVGHLLYDANIYDGMNTDMSDYEFYKSWLSKNSEAIVLELCCGTGRLTIPLAQEGIDITAVDITECMLIEAQKKATRAQLDINFHLGDMRDFDLKDSFDIIFIPFNSIHHLYTNDDFFNMLRCVKKHLKEDGLFIFDCFNPNIQFIAERGNDLKQISSYKTVDGRDILINEIMTYENDSQINRIEWHYSINGKFDSIQNLDMRMYFPQEIDAYLQWNGFQILRKFGNFQEQEFNKDSDKQIFVCKMTNI